MKDLFLEQVSNFVREFDVIYHKDMYISKKIYDNFLDKYTDIINLINKYPKYNDEVYNKFITIIDKGYSVIDKRNNLYINYKLEQEKNYFDNMFKEIDPNIMLDLEQRKAIIIDEDYSLIVAGAGSGKTTTMVAKVKYLIEKRHINPKNIILLSFTNNSVDDLDDMLNNKFKLNVEVLTFHKLGMKFLRNIYNKKIDIIADKGIYKVLEDYFLDVVFKNKELLKEYMNIFDKYLYLEPECLNYSNYDEYYKYYMDLKYEECKDNLDNEIKNRIKSRSRIFKTINGEYVKSEGEFKIANYLYTHNINYQYESIYPYKLKGNRTYKPDFTIDNFDNSIYVEYFGLAIIKENGEIISESDKYRQEIDLKKETHLNNKTDLISLYGRYENGDNYLPKLSYLLAKRNINRIKRSDKEIFYRLLETSKTYKYIKLIKVFSVFINLFKEKNYTLKDFSELEKNCNDNFLISQLKCLKEVYIYYQNKIHSEYKIDFQDMIHYAYLNMEKLKENTSLKYNYVIIDEYQDISYQRFSFIRKISELFNSKVVAVGDDWQTIYSFSGSDIDLFTRFSEIMGYSSETQITNTYRNSQELIDLAGDFILKNKYQLEKYLHSKKHLNKPVRLVNYNYNLKEDNLSQKLTELLVYLDSKYKDNSILLLSRFNSELDNLLESNLFYKENKTDDKIICKKVPNLDITFLTTHKSKGLGFDRVILLNGINGIYGFPSGIKDEPIIKYLKGEYEIDENIRDLIEYPEERRLFYVALTRTKNELYIMVPSIYKYKSDFIKEIEDNQNVVSIN